MERKKAVIFDVDGLLLNTEFTWLKCWEAVAEKNGLPEFGYLFHKAVGTTGRDIERMLERELPIRQSRRGASCSTTSGRRACRWSMTVLR